MILQRKKGRELDVSDTWWTPHALLEHTIINWGILRPKAASTAHSFFYCLACYDSCNATIFLFFPDISDWRVESITLKQITGCFKDINGEVLTVQSLICAVLMYSQAPGCTGEWWGMLHTKTHIMEHGTVTWQLVMILNRRSKTILLQLLLL